MKNCHASFLLQFIDIWMLSCMIFVFSAMLAFITAYMFHMKRKAALAKLQKAEQESNGKQPGLANSLKSTQLMLPGSGQFEATAARRRHLPHNQGDNAWVQQALEDLMRAEARKSIEFDRAA